MGTIRYGYTPALSETGVPAATPDGDQVDPWVDGYGRAVNPAYDKTDGSDKIEEQNPALLRYEKDTAISDLTAPGDTPESAVFDRGKYGYLITISGTVDAVVLELEGSIDESIYTTLDLNVCGDGAYSISNNQVTFNIAGNWLLWSDVPVYDVRLVFVSEGGTSTAVIASSFFARRV